VSKVPRASPEESTTLRIHPGVSATPGHPRATLHPEDTPDLESHSIILRPLRLYHYKVPTSSRSSPLRDLSCPVSPNFEPESPTTYRP